MQENKPVNKIKINDKLLILYRDINHNKKEYILENLEVIDKLRDIYKIEILDEKYNTWQKFNLTSKKWKKYIFKEYISRSRAMKGKNTWSKGRTPPNKGRTNIDFFGEEKAKEISKKISKKTIQYFKDDEFYESRMKRSNKLSKSLMGRERNWHSSGMKGKRHNEYSKEKIRNKTKENYRKDNTLKYRVSHFGKSNGMYGKKHSKESRKKISQALKKKYKENKFYREKMKINGARSMLSQNKRTPKTEVLVQNYLFSNDVNFIPNYVIDFYEYDLFIPHKNILIEVQGDYWHGNLDIFTEENLLEHQRQKKIKDVQKRTFAENKGFILLEIWEKDIKNKNFSSLKEVLC